MSPSVKSQNRVRNPEQTRSELLTAAFDEIHLNGFQAASVDHILKSTRVTKGAFYHHFSNKMAMGYAVVDEMLRPMVMETWSSLLDHSQNPIDGIMQVLEKKKEMCDDNTLKCGCPLNNLMQEMSPIDDGFRLRLQQIIDLFIQNIHQALKKGIENGYVQKGLEPETAAFFIVASIQGMVGIMKNSHDFEKAGKCMSGLIDYLNSIRA